MCNVSVKPTLKYLAKLSDTFLQWCEHFHDTHIAQMSQVSACQVV